MGDISDLRILYKIKNDIDMYIKYIDDEKTFKTYIPDADPNLSFTDQFIEKNQSMTNNEINAQINDSSIIYNESQSQSSRGSVAEGSQDLRNLTPASTTPASTPPPAPPAAPPAVPSVVSSVHRDTNNRSARSLISIVSISDPLDRTIALINELEEEQILKDAQLNTRQIDRNKQELISEFNGATEIILNELIDNPPNILSKDFDDENSSDLLMEYAIPWQRPSTRRSGKDFINYQGSIKMTHTLAPAGLPSSPFPASQQTEFHGPRPFRQRGGAKVSKQAIQIKRNQIDTVLNKKEKRIKNIVKILPTIKKYAMRLKSKEQIAREEARRGVRIARRRNNEEERQRQFASAITAGLQLISENIYTYAQANARINPNTTFIRESRRNKNRNNYDQGKWANQCTWINGQINENSRCFLCGIPFGISVDGAENREKLTNFHNYPNLKTVSKYSKESGEHIYTSIAGFGLIGYPNSKSDVTDINRSFYARGLDWCHFWCNLIKNELLFISFDRRTGILRVRDDNINWMIWALVWGTDRNQYFDSEYIKTILCKYDRKFVYPTYILAFIDGIYKEQGESFQQASNRFITDRITKLTARVTSTVNFLNGLNNQWRTQTPPSSLLLKYQTRLNNPERFIDNINYPSANMLIINANFIPVIDNLIPDSPDCNLGPAPVAASAPADADYEGGLYWPRFTGNERRSRKSKYKSRKTRKVRK
jgi:hypothetical protein